MKKVFLILISLLVIGTINVKAEEDYNIIIDENNSFTLTDSTNNQITDNTIAKYEDNTLTLGEGKYFNQIKVKSGITITSNDKEVYIKELTTKEDTAYIPANITINKLKVTGDETYIFKIDVGKNLTIRESEISSKGNYEIKGSVNITNTKLENTGDLDLRNSTHEEYGLKIVDSNIRFNDIELFYYFYTGGENTGNVLIKDSNVCTTKNIHNFTGPNTPDYIIRIENSTILSTNIMLTPNNLIIYNSNVETKGEFITEGSLSAGNIDIINSKVFAQYYIQPYSEDKIVKLNIENSEVETGYFYTSQYGYIPEDDYPLEDNIRFYAKNSKLKTSTTYSSLFGDTIFENCELDFQGPTNIRGSYALSSNKKSNLIIKNSSGSFTGGIIAKNNIEIKDSILFFSDTTGTDPYLFPLACKEDLKINNSNVIFDNTNNDKKPILVQGNIVLDNKILPIDQEKELLKVKELEDSTEERNAYVRLFDADKPIFSFAYEDESYTNYVQLATKKTATFKVKNGTWLDGTSDDIKIDYLYGEPLEIENLPKEVQELLTSKMGSWSTDLNNLDTTQDLDIEFKYDLINPETKRNLLILFVIIVISIVVFTKIKIKHVNY